MAEPTMADVKPQLIHDLVAALDLALPECYWRRRFLDIWRNQSLSSALAEWKKGPIKNPQYVTQAEAIVRRMLDDSTRR